MRSTYIFKTLFLLIFTLFFGTSSFEAQAERVLIKTLSTQQKGHAWLFSGFVQGRNECWLVMPRHVVLNSYKNQLEAVVFTTQHGQSGETGVPIAVDQISPDLSITNGEEDLAFAPVKFGKNSDLCKSTLGLNVYAYQTVIRSAENLNVQNLISTSYRLFKVRLTAGKIDSIGGALLMLEADRKEDAEKYFKSGLSGSVAEVKYNNAIYPMAMIIEVDVQKKKATAIRFDLIRAAFEGLLKSELSQKVYEESNLNNSNFELIRFSGDVLSNSLSLATIQSPEGCWKAKAIEGQGVLDIVLNVPDDQGINGIAVITETKCGNAGALISIYERSNKKQQWNFATECFSISHRDNKNGCFLDYRTPRQFRLQFSKQVSISEIRIQQN